MKNLIDKLVKLCQEKFHGKVTIHFANGCPKKIEMNQVEEI
jgi:hypothetical protein